MAVHPTPEIPVNARSPAVPRADKLRKITRLDLTPHSLRLTFTMVGKHLRLRREDIDRLTNQFKINADYI